MNRRGVGAELRDPSDLSELLVEGLSELGVAPRTDDLERLDRFLDMLLRWGRVAGLTAPVSRSDLVIRHVLDSVAALPFLPAGSGLDAGSGAGFPGLMLALFRPEVKWVLLDSSARKTAFLRQACIELDLPRVRVVRERLEKYQPAEPPEAIIARAMAPLPRLIKLATPLLRRGCRLIAMLGRRPSNDQLSAFSDVHCRSCDRVRVPGLDAQRHIAVFQYSEINFAQEVRVTEVAR